MTHALGERSEGDTLLLVDLLRRGLLEVRRGQLHLDDVGAELGGDVRGVRRDVDRGLALLGEPRAARVRPDDHGEPALLRLLGEGAELAVHRQPVLGAGIDREADPDAAEAHGILDAPRDRLRRVAFLEQHVVVAELQDQRHLARELARPRL